MRNVKKWKLTVKPLSTQIRTANGGQCRALGYVEIPFEYRGKRRIIPTLLIEEITKELILGIDFWNAFRISPFAYEVDEIEVPKQDILNESY